MRNAEFLMRLHAERSGHDDSYACGAYGYAHFAERIDLPGIEQHAEECGEA